MYSGIVALVGMCLANEAGLPLMVTRLLERNGAKTARQQARNELAGIEGYSGFFSVGKNKGVHLFFWYFPAVRNIEAEAALLVWLPEWNTSSLHGALVESGPFRVVEGKLQKTDYSWYSLVHLLFLDATPGVGFSFSDEGDFSTSSLEIGDNVYSALLQFLRIFPDLKSRRLYVGGLSYGSKYSSVLAHKIHNDKDLKLTGVLYSSSLIDPLDQFRFGEFLYNVGLVDANDKKVFDTEEIKFRKHAAKGENAKAAFVMADLIINKNSFFGEVTGRTSAYNFVTWNVPSDEFHNYVQSQKVRDILHVGNTTYWNGTRATSILITDMVFTVKPFLLELLNEGYQILFFSGQLDVVTCYPTRETMIDELIWTGAEGFRRAERMVWMQEGGVVEGYIRKYDNLVEAMINRAGHFTTIDQPRKVWNLLACFLWNCTITYSDRYMYSSIQT